MSEYWLPVVIVSWDGTEKNIRSSPSSASAANILPQKLSGELYAEMDLFGVVVTGQYRWFRFRGEVGSDVFWIRADVCKVNVISKGDIERRLEAVEERLTIIESQHGE